MMEGQILEVPGSYTRMDQLSEEYPEASQEDLIRAWNDYSPGTLATPVPGVLGVSRELLVGEKPKTLISVDLCEVVRHTKRALETDLGPDEREARKLHNSYLNRLHRTEDDVRFGVVTKMNNGHIEPVEGIENIRTILKSWRADGTYVVANTSTLEGCEVATIDYLREHLRGGFDGILFPRNYDNLSKISKADAVGLLLSKSGFDEFERGVHIDDLPGHQFSFESETAFTTFSPEYKKDIEGNEHTYPDSTRVIAHPYDPELNPLFTFIEVDYWLKGVPYVQG